jgi:ketosteroid isomerase-like protein
MDMDLRRAVLTLFAAAALVAETCVCTFAAQVSDTKAVAAANRAFIAALSSGDLTAMEQIWAHQPYVTNVGPRSRVRNTGYDAVHKYWKESFKYFSRISISSRETKIRVNGNVAWVVGLETEEFEPKSGGEPLAFETFFTNIFEKSAGRWLLVSHHAQAIPK